jgi:restriction system protein
VSWPYSSRPQQPTWAVTKGIFITTSDFSSNAREYVSNIDIKVVLIDGKQLAEFMIDHNVGVLKVSVYEIKKIDSDYFVEV